MIFMEQLLVAKYLVLSRTCDGIEALANRRGSQVRCRALRGAGCQQPSAGQAHKALKLVIHN